MCGGSYLLPTYFWGVYRGKPRLKVQCREVAAAGLGMPNLGCEKWICRDPALGTVVPEPQPANARNCLEAKGSRQLLLMPACWRGDHERYGGRNLVRVITRRYRNETHPNLDVCRCLCNGRGRGISQAKRRHRQASSRASVGRNRRRPERA